MTFKFAAGLALAAASAEATQYMNGSQFQPSSWGNGPSYQANYGSDSRWSQPEHQSYSPQPSYHSQHEQQQYHAPQYEQQQYNAPQQPSHQEWQQPSWEQPSWNPHSAPAPKPESEMMPESMEEPAMPAHNPWGSPAPSHGHHYPWGPPPTAAKPEGWYSMDSQYSPPQIAYYPAATKPRFAICEFPGTAVELAQLPGHPVYARAMIGGLTPGDVFYARINEKGRLGDYDNCDVELTGGEFNPLFETDKYGNANPFQDPARGTIQMGVADENGAIILDGQDSFMFQLEGPNSVIGRSITLTDGMDNIIACCTIGRDMAPMPSGPK